MAPMTSVTEIHGIYRHACPNCGGPISDLRLLHKAPCENCLPEEIFKKLVREIKSSSQLTKLDILEKYAKHVVKKGKLEELVEEERELRNFEEFFKQATNGYRMWSAQKTWARRLLRRESFSIVAPTGTGKTVFSLIFALYRSLRVREKGKKIYLVFPTRPLLIQSYEKLLSFAKNTNISICSDSEQGDKCLRIIRIHSGLRGAERKSYLERIGKGDFDILLTTSAFIHRYFEILPRGVYDTIIMDDVDAILRSSKAIKRLLLIMGLREEDIDKGLDYWKKKTSLGRISIVEQVEKTKHEIEELEKEIEKTREALKDTVLVVNSATGKPRGIYPKLFRVFLGFEAGSRPEAIRNIVDTFINPDSRSPEELLVDLINRLRDGILVFVPVDKGIDYAENLAKKLREMGYRVEAFHSKRQSDVIERFTRGELDILVGVATYYGVMVRGIDLPERVKYVIFTGIPRHRFSPVLEEISPIDLLRTLMIIRELLGEEEKRQVDMLIERISRKLKTMSKGALYVLRNKLTQVLRGESLGEEQKIVKDLVEAYNIVKDKLSRPELIEKLRGLGDIRLDIEGDTLYISIPDVATYIQASGRCSRLYPGGITKGLSVLIVDDIGLFNGLLKKLRWVFEDFEIHKLEEVDLDKLINEISEEREVVKKIFAGKIQPTKSLELLKTALFIVESPNKARTISNMFGKPSVRVLGEGIKVHEVALGEMILDIVATGGHVYDLAVDDYGDLSKSNQLYHVLIKEGGEKRGKKKYEFIPIYTDIKHCIRGHEFVDESSECPKCKIRGTHSPLDHRKIDVIEVLRKLAREVDEVLIGTDPDTEGEKIAWDVRVLLEPYADKVRRVEFHEVTRRAIINAIKNPRDFDKKLVEAQIVRRVEDRWLGFSLSQILQKYAWLKYCYDSYRRGRIKDLGECCRPNRNLSAGRVQTPVLGFIIEEYEKYMSSEYSRYLLNIAINERDKLTIQLSHHDIQKLNIRDEAELRQLNVFIDIVDEHVEEVNPLPPFTTDKLLEEASRKLWLPTSETMKLAQDLFEMGFITYHRTDSTRISDVGIEIAREYIKERFRDRSVDLFKPRTWGVEGAHEAIRPTKSIDAEHLAELIQEGVITTVRRVTRDHLRLYDLVFRRFIASQMKPAKVIKQRLKIRLEFMGNIHEFEKEVVVSVVDKGYSEIYDDIRVDIPRTSDPGTSIRGVVVDVEKIRHPLPRFHDVVKWMKENNIGRPSTYAEIIETLLNRRYVMTLKKRKALVTMRKGIVVYEFLTRYFKDIVNVNTTSKLEKLMDKIEKGRIGYQRALAKIHEEVMENILRKEIEEKITSELYSLLDMCKTPESRETRNE